MSSKVRDWILVICSITMTLSVIIGGFAKIRELPTKGDIREIARESVQEITTIMVEYRENPGSAWTHVYQESTREAANKQYIENSPSGYVTAERWKGNNRLVNEIERRIIEKVVKSAPKMDTASLTHKAWTELRALGEISLKIKTHQKEISLSRYEKIGIIRGYIQEIRGICS